MNDSILEFKEKLIALDPSKEDDVVHYLYDLVDLIENVNGAEIVIPDILKYMEKHPLIDLGSPGPLVHFIEDYYPSYLEPLISSVKHKPTIHTLFMVNRILNSELENDIRENLLSILNNIKNNKNNPNIIREEAKGYYEFQINKNS